MAYYSRENYLRINGNNEIEEPDEFASDEEISAAGIDALFADTALEHEVVVFLSGRKDEMSEEDFYRYIKDSEEFSSPYFSIPPHYPSYTVEKKMHLGI